VRAGAETFRHPKQFRQLSNSLSLQFRQRGPVFDFFQFDRYRLIKLIRWDGCRQERTISDEANLDAALTELPHGHKPLQLRVQAYS